MTEKRTVTKRAKRGTADCKNQSLFSASVGGDWKFESFLSKRLCCWDAIVWLGNDDAERNRVLVLLVAFAKDNNG